jgi:Uncharacterised protein family (UPF0172)
MTENELPRSTVCITPEVLALLVGHATSHSTTTIHGALIGQFFKGKVEITDTFPICHENSYLHPCGNFIVSCSIFVGQQHK